MKQSHGLHIALGSTVQEQQQQQHKVHIAARLAQPQSKLMCEVIAQPAAFEPTQSRISSDAAAYNPTIETVSRIQHWLQQHNSTSVLRVVHLDQNCSSAWQYPFTAEEEQMHEFDRV